MSKGGGQSHFQCSATMSSQSKATFCPIKDQGSTTLPPRRVLDNSNTQEPAEISQALDDSELHVYEEIPDFIRPYSFRSSQSSQNWRKSEQPLYKWNTNESETPKRKVQTADSALFDSNKPLTLTRSRSRYSIHTTQESFKSPCIKKRDISYPVHAGSHTKVTTKHAMKSKEELRKEYKHRPPPRVPDKSSVNAVKEGETYSTELQYEVPSVGQRFQAVTQNSKTVPEKTVPKHVDAKQSQDECTLNSVNKSEKDLLVSLKPGHSSSKSGDSNQPPTAEVCIPSATIGSNHPVVESDSETYTPLIPMRRKRKKNKTDQLSSDYATFN